MASPVKVGKNFSSEKSSIFSKCNHSLKLSEKTHLCCIEWIKAAYTAARICNTSCQPSIIIIIIIIIIINRAETEQERNKGQDNAIYIVVKNS